MINVENDDNRHGYWRFSEEEMLKILNRMNDTWEADPSDLDGYIATVNRFIGCLDALITPDHYFKLKELKI